MSIFKQDLVERLQGRRYEVLDVIYIRRPALWPGTGCSILWMTMGGISCPITLACATTAAPRRTVTKSRGP